MKTRRGEKQSANVQSANRLAHTDFSEFFRGHVFVELDVRFEYEGEPIIQSHSLSFFSSLNLTYLCYLSLHGWHENRFPKKIIHYIAKCINLKFLNLAVGYTIDDYSLTQIIKNCRKLIVLIIKDAGDLIRMVRDEVKKHIKPPKMSAKKWETEWFDLCKETAQNRKQWRGLIRDLNVAG